MTRLPGTRAIINDVLDDFQERGYRIESVAYDSSTFNVYDGDDLVGQSPSWEAKISIVLARRPKSGETPWVSW